MAEDPVLFSILLLWGGWGIICAWGWRFALPRYAFRFKNRLVAVILTYISMAGMVAFSAWFLDYSGWHLKGSNDEPLQMAGGIVFFLSPIGWPLVVGGPVVFIADIALFLKRLWEPAP